MKGRSHIPYMVLYNKSRICYNNNVPEARAGNQPSLVSVKAIRTIDSEKKMVAPENSHSTLLLGLCLTPEKAYHLPQAYAHVDGHNNVHAVMMAFPYFSLGAMEQKNPDECRAISTADKTRFTSTHTRVMAAISLITQVNHHQFYEAKIMSSHSPLPKSKNPFSQNLKITPKNLQKNTIVGSVSNILVPIKAEDGGDRADGNGFEEEGGEHEKHGEDEGQSGAELGGPVVIEGDADDGGNGQSGPEQRLNPRISSSSAISCFAPEDSPSSPVSSIGFCSLVFWDFEESLQASFLQIPVWESLQDPPFPQPFLSLFLALRQSEQIHLR
nr:hypothetical protein Iba_chr01dCG17470 [Ipomoea batatas]